MPDPIARGDTCLAHEFLADLYRLLREGLVHLTYDDPDAPPRFYVTAAGRRELQAPILDEAF